jgi:excinuclease UvrABC nuclease subunit
MLEAANHLEFEKAALLRDQIRELKHRFGQGAGPVVRTGKTVAAKLNYRTARRRR